VKYGVLLGTAWKPLFCGGLFHHIVNIGSTPRQWQSRAALALLNKHNVMLISATDSEKSLAFQSLSLLKEGSQQLGESLQEIRAGKTAVPVKTNRKQEWFDGGGSVGFRRPDTTTKPTSNNINFGKSTFTPKKNVNDELA
jgi:hypothetical protein